MAMKKEKSNARKRSNGQRSTEDIGLPEATEKAFCALVEGVWDSLIGQKVMDGSSLTELQMYCNFCILAWDSTMGDSSPEEVKGSVSDLLRDILNIDDENAADFIKTVIDIKHRHYPNFGLPIIEAKVTLRSGKPHIAVTVDDGSMDEDDDFPELNAVTGNFIDREAMDKALEGVPADQVEAAFRAELQAQVDLYNNTPQAALGGLTPSEMHKRGRKKC